MLTYTVMITFACEDNTTEVSKELLKSLSETIYKPKKIMCLEFLVYLELLYTNVLFEFERQLQ